MLDPTQYEFRFFFTTLADPEPGAGAETSIFRLWLRLRPKVSAPCGSGSTSLQFFPVRETFFLIQRTKDILVLRVCLTLEVLVRMQLVPNVFIS
jgi:hypothetical protein